jgi:ABC-type phosphate transport system auxiliary subunit
MGIFKNLFGQKDSSVAKPSKSSFGSDNKKAELIRRLRSIQGLPHQINHMVEKCADDIEADRGLGNKLERHISQMNSLVQLGNAMVAAGRSDAAVRVAGIARELNALLGTSE